MSTDSPVRVADLTKAYGRRVAVDGVTFDVPAGCVFGFLGPNGAGKTTTIRMLLGLIRPQRGAVWLCGAAMRPSHPVLARVGALVDGPAFPRFLTGRRHLTNFARCGRRLDTPVAGRVTDVLDRVGLREAADRRISTYSTGMRQRLGLAQALLTDPDVLVLDEPSNGLDPGGMHDVRTLIGRLREAGRTIFLSTHLLAEVEQICDRVAVVAAGRLVAAGTLDQVRAGATLESAYLNLTGHSGVVNAPS
ncbi:MAG: ATP-binding cassette domain-containing protein [Micromonosporaceae bacterium]|nr:ATP-binding cassette domain-containing protein [Micromonosporaceae bacterium]